MGMGVMPGSVQVDVCTAKFTQLYVGKGLMLVCSWGGGVCVECALIEHESCPWGPGRGGSAAGSLLFQGDAHGLPSSAMLLPAAQQVKTLA